MNYMCAPFELFFCGRSGSGKTFLLRRLTQILQHRSWQVGYVKHDAHQFVMDYPGKDTQVLWEAGARSVCIADKDHSAMIVKGSFHSHEKNALHQSVDVVFVEGYKSLPHRKIVLLHPDGNWDTVQNLENVAAVIGSLESRPAIYTDVPYFHRDDIEAIAAFVINEMKEKAQHTPLYGLVLAGGRSQRMQKDKAWLDYEGRPQIARIYDELSKVCEKVFVSCRPEQWNFPEGTEQQRFTATVPLLPDRLLNFGPLGGILSALLTYPEASFLVSAVDMPYVQERDLQGLLSFRNPFKSATCFINPDDGLIEPLCAIYEAKSRFPLLDALGRGRLCPRKILADLDVVKVSPANPMSVSNINQPDEYAAVLRNMLGDVR